MTGSVIAVAAAAIALVNWYFLFGRTTARAALTAAGVQDVTVRVEGGYDPAIVEVKAGQPVRLTFDRRENNPCSDEVVVAKLGIRRDLPAFQKTTIEFTPPAPADTNSPAAWACCTARSSRSRISPELMAFSTQ